MSVNISSSKKHRVCKVNRKVQNQYIKDTLQSNEYFHCQCPIVGKQCYLWTHLLVNINLNTSINSFILKRRCKDNKLIAKDFN